MTRWKHMNEEWEVRDIVNDLLDNKIELIARQILDENIDYENDIASIVRVLDEHCCVADNDFTEDEIKHALSKSQYFAALLLLESQGIVVREDNVWKRAEYVSE